MLKHNKKRNSFIVYEQLISLTTRLAAEGKKDAANIVVEVMKKHFRPNTQLNREYKLMDSVISSRGFSKEVSEKIITEALSEAKTLNEKRLDYEKTKLIESINKHLSKTLFNIPVSDYKIAASVQILMNESRSGTSETTPIERVKVKNLLVERLSRPIETQETEAVDNITFALLISKFNKRYSKVMNEDQREILSVWTTFLIDENKEKAEKVLNEKVNKLKLSLSKLINSSAHKSSEYKPSLNEAYTNLVNQDIQINENSVYEMMRYFDLIEDLQNYAQKEKGD